MKVRTLVNVSVSGVVLVAICSFHFTSESKFLKDLTTFMKDGSDKESVVVSEKPMLAIPDNRSEEYSHWSPLRDKTLYYDPDVERLWLMDSLKEKPPAMLLMTSIGWNNENLTWGLEKYRGLRTRELVQGVINHPWFHPTAWDDFQSGRLEISNTTRYYVFFDRDTCGDKNYPRYGAGAVVNADKKHNRGTCCGFKELYTQVIAEFKLFASRKYDVKLVLFDCSGWGPQRELLRARKILGEARVVFISVSAAQGQLIWGQDQGQPPAPCNKCVLTPEERRSIETCESEHQRRILVSFSGAVQRSQARKGLRTLHNDKDILIGRGRGENSIATWVNESNIQLAYRKLATSTAFGASPRGDNLFSYRFTEVLSCGAIPAVYADEWKLPFGYDLVDWREAVLVIPERDANLSEAIMRSVPLEKRCRMRKRGLELYDRYISTGEGTIRGIVASLESAATGKSSYTGPAIPLRHCHNNGTGLDPRLGDNVCWEAGVKRLWLDNDEGPNPPAMLLIMAKGPIGNEPHARELMHGVMNHPWFHPTFLDDTRAGNVSWSNETRYYVFADVESCVDNSYPYYNLGQNGTYQVPKRREAMDALKEAETIFPPTVQWRVVYFDCNGSFKRYLESNRLAAASVSGSKYRLIPHLDHGIPAPVLRRFRLGDEQRLHIDECRSRPYFLFFAGNTRSATRKDLRRFHNGKDVWIGEASEMQQWLGKDDPYFSMAERSSFAAVVSGPTAGASAARLVEMMSAGAIPVILADGWELPLSSIIDWKEIAVLIPEMAVDDTLQMLSNVSSEEQCRMRQAMMRVYDQYFQSSENAVKGLIESLEKTRMMVPDLTTPRLR